MVKFLWTSLNTPTGNKQLYQKEILAIMTLVPDSAYAPVPPSALLPNDPSGSRISSNVSLPRDSFSSRRDRMVQFCCFYDVVFLNITMASA